MKTGLGPMIDSTMPITARSVTGHMRWMTPKWSVASKRGHAGNGPLEDILGVALGIGVEAENLAQIRLACPGQQQPVLLWPGHGFFVRIDVSLAKP